MSLYFEKLFVLEKKRGEKRVELHGSQVVLNPGKNEKHSCPIVVSNDLGGHFEFFLKILYLNPNLYIPGLVQKKRLLFSKNSKKLSEET